MAEKIHALYRSFGGLDGVSIECQKELIAIGVSNQSARAEIFLQGAQITAYQRHSEDPVLFLSRECQYKQGASLRGGIPICWPWFGDLSKNKIELQNQFSSDFIDGAPAHGFVRDLDWDVSDIRIIDNKETRLILECDIPFDSTKGWPFAARLVYEVSVGEALKVTFSVKNRGDKPFIYSAALHSYFKVENIKKVSIPSLDNVFYVDAMKNWETFGQQGDVVFDREVDRIYSFSLDVHDVDGYSIELNDTKRSLKIESAGSASAVVWNPWIEKSKRLSQFADDEYQKMVCIEIANAGDDLITLAPDQEHVLSIKIT